MVGVVAADEAGAGLALGTAQGVVKRVAPDYPQNAAEFEVIALKDGDRVVGAVQLPDEGHDLVFITSDAQLLRFAADAVRPQGRAAGGMAGIRLSPRATVIWFGAVDPAAWATRSRATRPTGRPAACPASRSWSPWPTRPARCPARRPRSRSPRTPSTRPRAGPPAGSAATGS